jgi:small subunit ribosomal protein S20
MIFKKYFFTRGKMEKEKIQKTKIPTAKKRMLQNEKKRQLNCSFKSKVKTAIRSFRENLQKNSKEESQDTLNLIYSLMDKGQKKEIYKKNKAQRIKSRLSSLLNKIG